MTYLILAFFVFTLILGYLRFDTYRIKRFQKTAKKGTRCQFLEFGYMWEGVLHSYTNDHMYSYIETDTIPRKILSQDIYPRNCFEMLITRRFRK